MKFDQFLAAAFVTVVVGLGICSWYYGKTPLAPSMPSAMPAKIEVPPAPVLSVYNASPKLDSDLPTNDELKRKDNALERCYMGGGVPVMGFGFRVVCLKPQSAEWWDDPTSRKK